MLPETNTCPDWMTGQSDRPMSTAFMNTLLELIKKIPLLPLGVLALVMSLAPFQPEPHLLEKTRMLLDGSLSRPIDIFDLFLHSIFLILFIFRLTISQTRHKHKDS